MKILEITAFSAGACGVWARVQKESELLLKKGHEVRIFSSNVKRGSGKLEFASLEDNFNGIKIKRFMPFGHFGENSFFWNFEKEALGFKPDVIITHAYRQYYSTRAIKIAKKLGVPCILVTHAPFVDKKFRKWYVNLMTQIYDFFVGKKILNNYSKIFTITKWEVPYLLNLNVDKEKIEYVPNGVPDEYFEIKKKNMKRNSILFLGRIAPVKDLETLLFAFKIVLEKSSKTVLNLVGPVEEDYGKKVNELIENLGLRKNVVFHGPVYDLNKKLKLIDECGVYVLPSKREGMPQSLIEVMAREKIVISSSSDGGKEIVENGKNGYLFEIGDYKKLAKLILKSLEKSDANKKIENNARKSVEQFRWSKISEKIDGILRSLK